MDETVTGLNITLNKERRTTRCISYTKSFLEAKVLNLIDILFL